MFTLFGPEKTAVVLLILVTVTCLLGTLLLDGMGKSSFSKAYEPGMADGTLVTWSGTVGTKHVTSGGILFLEVSGVSVFVPAGGDTLGIFEGNQVEVTGTVSHWKGKEEILVEDPHDIRVIG